MFVVFCYTRLCEAEAFECETLLEALDRAKMLRECGNRFVTVASELPECVTLPGVDSVVGGKLPNGDDYTWKKRRI